MYKQFQVIGPFGGIVDSMPAPTKPANTFDDILNFVCRHGRLQTRPGFSNFGAPPDSAVLCNALTFQSPVNTFHTLALTPLNAYFLTSGPVYNLLTYPMGFSNLGNSLGPNLTPFPYALMNVINRVYFTNGSKKLLYVDGSSAVKVAGDVQGAARYGCVLGNRIILGHTTEPQPGDAGSFENPFRIRWCVSGDPNDWTGFGSGFEDLLEVPDSLTGLCTLGRNGYAFRRNGISTIFTTGDFQAPFSVEQFSNAPKGTGNRFPYALAVYGNIAAFVSDHEIFSFNGTELTPIGGKAKKKIYADLANAEGSQVLGFINPNIGTGYDLLSYWLCIPGVNIAWIYLFDSDSWQRFLFPGGGTVAFAGSVAIG